MKTKFIFLFFFSLLLSCSLSNDDSNSQDNGGIPGQLEQWTLINVSGGIEGADNDFLTGDIIWAFNSNTGILSVNNTNLDPNTYSSLSTGSYTFSVNSNGHGWFILIDSEEFGELKNNGLGTMVIDRSNLSTGSVSDAYILTLNAVN